jgi:hypothetical protein
MVGTADWSSYRVRAVACICLKREDRRAIAALIQSSGEYLSSNLFSNDSSIDKTRPGFAR